MHQKYLIFRTLAGIAAFSAAAMGQNVIFIGDVAGGVHRSEARAMASLAGGQDLLVVGASLSDMGPELTTFTTGDELNPPELFIHPDPPGSAPGTAFRAISDITPDGQWVVGRQYDETGALRGFVSGPFGGNFTWLGHSPDATVSRATGISDDGSRIVGQVNDTVNGRRAVYWDENRDMHFLPEIAGYESFSWAYDISADGQVIAGFAELWDENFNPIDGVSFVWTEAQGIQLLESELGAPVVLVISDDGSLAGGRIYGLGESFPAYWSLADLQPVVLPVPPGYETGQVDSFSADGTLATGYIVDEDESQGPLFTAVIWDLSNNGALTFFREWAMQRGCSFNGAHVQSVAMLPDGETFHGEILFPETDAVEGYVAQIDPNPTDLTIVGRLPYPDNRTQSGEGGRVFLRDIDPLGRLAGGQGNFHEGLKSVALPVRWTPATGLVQIQPLTDGTNPDIWAGRFGRVYDVTTFGDLMVGQGFAPESWGFGFLGDAQGGQFRLPVSETFFPIDGEVVVEESRAFAVTDDGGMVVGQVNARGRLTPNRAAYWTNKGEAQLFSVDVPETVSFSYATDVSANGSTVNGWCLIENTNAPGTFSGRAIVWQDFAPRLLPFPQEYARVDSWFMSHDGSTTGGSVYNINENAQPVDRKAIIWNLASDTYELIETPETWTEPNMAQFNFDGTIATGQAMEGDRHITFVWDRDRGVFEAGQYLETVCGYDLGPYEVTLAQLNDEGTHMVGQVLGKYGEFAFFVQLPEQLVPAAARYLWRTAPARDDAYKFIDWFGWLADSGTYPWVWHIEHGWIFTQGGDPNSFLMFDGNLQTWWLIERSNYPWMFKLGSNSRWYYYYAPFGTPAQRFFYDPATGQSGLEDIIFP